MKDENERAAPEQPEPPVAEQDTVHNQSPEDFYAKAVARPDIAEILRRLAQ
ncbi:MAG TPA: hypothetical protein VII06_08365 [Chloroflexota bacterium]|jgi:hypothetical protein